MAPPPLFVFISPFLQKISYPPSDSSRGGGGGSNYGQWILKIADKASKTKITNHDSDCENEEM